MQLPYNNLSLEKYNIVYNFKKSHKVSNIIYSDKISEHVILKK